MSLVVIHDDPESVGLLKHLSGVPVDAGCVAFPVVVGVQDDASAPLNHRITHRELAVWKALTPVSL